MQEKPPTMPCAQVLGQLLLMQNVLCNLPDERSIYSFICRGLECIPGIGTVRYQESSGESDNPASIHISLTAGESNFGDLSITTLDPAALAPYLDYLSNFCFMVAVILEERNQRRQIEQHKALLEQRVEERTQQLTDEIAERQMAEVALRDEARRKDEFLAMLSHELRNPLAPLRNAVEVMHLCGEDKAVMARQQAIIDRQTKHMSRLLDDLLDVGLITRSTIRLRKERLALRDVVEQAIETTMISTGPRRDDFSYRIIDDLDVEGDFTRLVQALGNLLSNAVKYSDPGQRIQLTVYRDPFPPPDHLPEAVLKVEDWGMGIAPDILPCIFDLFVQADNSLARTRGGLGIGLTLVHRIVELHGGRVLATSEGPGKGSTFCLWLPASPMHLTPQLNQGAKRSPCPMAWTRPRPCVTNKIRTNTVILCGTTLAYGS